MSDNCIFCKIVKGEIPCTSIYENEKVLAFMDINPWSQGHSLIIPKAHYALLDECPPDVLADVFREMGVVAKAVVKAVGASGYNILNNNGRNAGQLVDHVHFHIIPRSEGDGIIKHGKQGSYEPGEMDAIAEAIKNCL